jgi:hypothetical protein
MPTSLRDSLAAEGLCMLAEGLSGTIRYRDYRARGQASPQRRRVAISGAIAMTNERLVVWDGRGRHMDLPLARPVRPTVTVSADRPDRVTFAYDARAFDRDCSGTIEIQLRTAQATLIADRLNVRRSDESDTVAARR